MSEPTTSPAASPLRVSTEPRPAHDPTEALAAALFQTQDERLHGGADGLGLGSHEADAGAILAALSAAGWHLTRDGDETQTAARRLVDASDALARWDEAHGYIINSERDALAGDVSQGWASLRAALDSDR